MRPIRRGEVRYHPNPNPARNQADPLSRSCVYVPPESTNRVLYLLHGVGDNEYSWELQAGVSSLIEELVATGCISTTLVAMPFGFVTEENKRERRFPDRDTFAAYFSEFVTTFETFYEDRKALCEDKKALSPGARDRALAGLSMGGKQALEFGFAEAQIANGFFRAIGSFSAAIHDRGKGAAVDDINALAVASMKAGKAPRLYCSCGRQDAVPRLADANKSLAETLQAAGFSDEFHWLPGGHEWPLWHRSLKEFLKFWGQA